MHTAAVEIPSGYNPGFYKNKVVRFGEVVMTMVRKEAWNPDVELRK